MYYLVAYDIASGKRLRGVAKLCKNYGVRIQKSFFECHLEMDAFESFWEKLQAVTHAPEDRILVFPICSTCLKRIRQNIPVIHPEPVSMWIF